MRHRKRSAFSQLLAKTWDNGSVASENIAETGRDEMGFPGMTSARNGESQTLNIHFCQTLRSAHG